MKMSHPLSTVSPGLHGGVLTVLTRTDRPLTGRAVAALVDPPASLSGVQKVLDHLVHNGLLRWEPAGRAKLYTLNRAHLAYPSVHSLVHFRDELLGRIRAEADAWQVPADGVWMFGSAARGEAGADSDIDLLVIGPRHADDSDDAWMQQVDTLSEHVSAWTGNRCDILELTRAELDDAVERDDRLVGDLRRDTIHLIGDAPRTALRRRVMR